MPRKPRIFFENAHYHVTDRGNDKHDIFVDDLDRREYLKLLGQGKRDFGFLIPAYALLTNHVHLYLVTPKANLGEAMFWLNNTYSHYFNHRHGKSGHLFEGRYKYKLIQWDRYSMALARYIHLNPVRAGIVKSPEDYEWSSHRQYLAPWAGGLSDPSLVLDLFGSTHDTALAGYTAFMNEPIPPKLWRIFDKNRNAVLGSPDFRKAHSPH
ncbi:MAG: transposase [Elusimicrobiales bacterium]|jgi:REP element-mobilizing transposase RayT